MTDPAHYQSPFSTRYSSREMSHLFSIEYRSLTWRKLWIALAKAQKNLGLPITDVQIRDLEKHQENFDWPRLGELEKKLKHDVMAHIEGYGEVAPSAKGILHLGATSCYVTDNGDLIAMKEALMLLETKIASVMRVLADFAASHASLITISYTHFQPAQPTTVGKRASLWLQDFAIDLKEFSRRRQELPFLGIKGATGSQASLMTLLHDDNKILQLEGSLAKTFGFANIALVSGQTYTRKIDILVLDALAGFAASAHKFATDLRLLAHLHEIAEPFGNEQVGSSAMPHKRNPIYAERICGIARYLISLKENPSYTLATQWLERTLDDSSNRRITIPEAFLAADAICHLLFYIVSGMVVQREPIAAHLDHEKKFLCLEEILMEAVKKGGDRQALHAKLREIAKAMRKDPSATDLVVAISKDPAFSLTKGEVEHVLQKSLGTGLSEKQVHRFLKEEIFPLIEKYQPHLMQNVEI